MTTERLDLDDSRLLRFEARVLSAGVSEQGAYVVLDRTAFHPEGGGQPADRGQLGEARVVDVQDQEGELRHYVVDGSLPPGISVQGDVDGERRFDHMQQHSGQHLLSRCFIDLLDAETVSFHLGARSSTIDVARDGVGVEQLLRIEEEAARIIREDRRVTASVHDPEDAAGLGLRRDPSVQGAFRVVTIEDHDRCPCGGTHVQRTGEIEAIVLLRVERRKSGISRVEFVCGGRARRDHRARVALGRELTRLLSVEEARVGDAVSQALVRLERAEKQVRDLSRQLVPFHVDRLLAEAETLGGMRVVLHQFEDRGEVDLRSLGQELAHRSRVVAVLLLVGDRGQLLAVCSEESMLSARQLVADLLESVNGRGGGSDRLAQGGFDDPGAAAALLTRARTRLLDSLAKGPAGDSHPPS